MYGTRVYQVSQPVIFPIFCVFERLYLGGPWTDFDNFLFRTQEITHIHSPDSLYIHIDRYTNRNRSISSLPPVTQVL